MIELINEFVSLKRKLDEEFGIIGLSWFDTNVQMDDFSRILMIAEDEGLEVFEDERHDEYPLEIYVEHSGYTFFTLLTPDEMKEYKKATAPTVTSDKS